MDPPKSRPSQLAYGPLKTQLLARPGQVLPPTPSSASQTTAHAIASLSIHPALESALHILNDDLSSAHFLLRHMQAPPQFESMYLHGILHRIEGDYDNARAWYANVQDAPVFRAAWGDHGGLEGALGFIRRIEVLRKETRAPQRDPAEMKALSDEGTREMTAVVEYCEKTLGTAKMEDASGLWCQSERSAGQGSDMVIGGEGWRQF